MRILFVCTGNTCRSPMAEAVARHLMQKTDPERKIEFLSAGVHAADGEPASSGALAAAAARGIDLKGHRSRRATRELLESADAVYAMTSGHRHQLLALAPHLAKKVRTLAGAKDIGDPFGASVEIYEHVLKEIEKEVRRIIGELGR